MIADIIHARDYAKHLTKIGAGKVAVRPLGWRFWYGGPWMGARLITATRPPAG